MAYGTVKVDNITFTNGGIDQTVTVSGIVQSISGNITATGTIQGATIIGTSTVSGATVTGNAGVFTTVTGGSAGFTTVTGTTVTGTTANFNVGTFTSQVSGATITGNLAQFTSITGGTAGFTTVTGTTVTGTTANFVTLSGTTVTGNAGQFTTITGGTVTLTSGVFGAGTAALPSIAFTGDLNTGIYSPGADQVAISTNGTGRLFVAADGKVGILRSPQYELDVLGSARLPNSAWIYFNNAAGNAQQVLTVFSDNSTYLDAASGGDIVFRPNASQERARLTSTGRLGLGTSSPSDPLHIAVSGANSANIRLQSGDGRTYNVGSTGSGYGSSGKFIIYDITAGAERFCINSSGNVGVGTTSVSFDFQVDKDVNSLVTSYTRSYNAGSSAGGRVTAASNVGSLNMSAYSSTHSTWPNTCVIGSESTFTGGLVVLAGGANPLQFWTNSTERARIDSSGRLLVGTSSAYSSGSIFEAAGSSGGVITLVNTNINISGANSVFGQINFYTADTSGGNTGIFAKITAESNRIFDGDPASGMDLKFYTGNVGTGANTPTERLRINSSGQIAVAGAGSASAPTITKNDDLNTGIFFPAADTIAFAEGGTESARFDSSGRLLVGTSSARNVFDNLYAPRLQVEGTDGTHALSVVINIASTDGPYLLFGKSRGTSAGSNTVVQNGDRLGTIVCQGADGAKLVRAAQIEAFVDGTPGTDDMPGRLVFATTADGASSPTERMRIQANGRILIGSTSDSGANQLQVTGPSSTNSHAGRFNSGNTTSNGINVFLSGTRSSDTTYTAFKGTDDNTTFFRVYGNGDTQNTNNSYAGTSDLKLKENIVDANSQWTDIKALKVRKYNFKADSGFSTHTQIGLVAQEAELVSPGLVGQSPDFDAEGNDLGTVTKSVNYSVLYMKAVKALQEAMERIETLEAEMAAVKSQLV